jgi:hypothetical protein
MSGILGIIYILFGILVLLNFKLLQLVFKFSLTAH